MNISNQSNVTYNAIIPDEGTIQGEATSNTVSTENLSSAIVKEITTSKTLVKAGEIVHNKVTVTNNSSAQLIYTFISNPTPKGGSYVAGSVKVNGVEQTNKDMISGFFLPDMNPGDTVVIEYDLKVDEPMTVNPVVDVSQYQYTVNKPKLDKLKYKEYTDKITLNVISEKLSVVKSVDKTYAVKGETLTYTITITNEGNVDINDIYFRDNIPQGTTFVENSVIVDGVSNPAYLPEIGYKVADLAPNQSTTTSFKVIVN